MGFLRWTSIACLLAVLIGHSAAQFREYPPRYSYHNLPQTKFTCEGRLPARYYADPDTDCQMFHVCTRGSNANFRFLCPNGTVFDQEHQVCADYYQVVCHSNVGTNPLGHIFEIYKIGAKENTRAQEFGTAPSRDPVYLGQNSLTEDFQAEEYNNNKLASQNALHFQSGGDKSSRKKGGKSDIFYFASSSTTPRPTQPPRPVTTTTTTTRRPQSTTIAPSSFFEPRVLEARPIRPQQQQQPNLISSNLPQPRPQQQQQPIVLSSRPPQPQPQSQPSTTPKPAPVFKSTIAAAPTIPTTKFAFTDFNSLSKFQYDFHHSFTTRQPPPPTTTDFPSTTTDRWAFATSTYRPFFTEDANTEAQFFNTDRSTQGTTYRTTTFPTTTFKPTKPTTKVVPKTFAPEPFEELESPKTTRRSLFGNSNPFTDFKSLASFQHAFHHGFTTRGPTTAVKQFHTEVKPAPQEPVDSFNYQTTAAPRKQVFHSTFRASPNDVPTTSDPATFQQQSSRFNEEFFRKIESKYDTAAKQPSDSDFQNNQEINSTRAEEFNEIVTARPIRRGERRRRPQGQQQQQQPINNGQYKFSRRVENARFDDRESFAVRERYQSQRRNDEIFEADSSIFRGSPTINNFYNEERRPVQNRADPSKPVAPQEYTPALFGRRVRPHTRQRIVQTPDEPVDTQAEEKPARIPDRTRVVKRVRRPTTTTEPSTTEQTTTSSTTTTTLRTTTIPVKKFQLRAKLSTTTRKDSISTRPTTTEEPQLVTASDVEIAGLREGKSTTPTLATSTSTSVTRPVASTSFKVVEVKQPVITVTSSFDNNKNNTKIFIQTTRKPISTPKQEASDPSPTRSPDYDYTYYDSDVETDYLADLVSRQEKYGKKPSKNNLSKS